MVLFYTVKLRAMRVRHDKTIVRVTFVFKILHVTKTQEEYRGSYTCI